MKIGRRTFLIALLFAAIAAWLGLVALEHWYRPAPDYAEIAPGLYMGGYVLEPPSGTTAVLNLCEQEDPYQCEVHVWEPIRDAAPAPSIDWLAKQVAFIEEQRSAGRVVYVHCFQGASRSGLVVTAYVMHAHGWTRNEAMAFIRTKRPQLRPNPAFMELLLEWERRDQKLVR